MPLWYTPTPSPYVPHDPSWKQPLYLHLAPLWREVSAALATLSGEVLDVGCGSRPYRARLGPGVTRYVGLDRAGTSPPPDVVGDAHALPFADASFDHVMSMQVLEHVTDPALCVREIARVLRPGGSAVLTAPGVWPAHEIPWDFWRFTRFGMERIAADAGLVVEAVVPLGGLWSSVGQMAVLELERSALGRVMVPLVNLCARALDDRGAHHELVMNWLVRARKPL